MFTLCLQFTINHDVFDILRTSFNIYNPNDSLYRVFLHYHLLPNNDLSYKNVMGYTILIYDDNICSSLIEIVSIMITI